MSIPTTPRSRQWIAFPGSPGREVLVVRCGVRAWLHLEADNMLRQHDRCVPVAGLNINADCVAPENICLRNSPVAIEREERQFALQYQERL